MIDFLKLLINKYDAQIDLQSALIDFYQKEGLVPSSGDFLVAARIRKTAFTDMLLELNKLIELHKKETGNAES